MRKSVRAALLLALVFAAVLSAGTAGAKPMPVESDSAKLSQFPGANACGCHAALIDQWRASMHAKALEDPLYRTKLAEGQKATGGKLGPFCNKCHGPVATMTGTIDREDLGGAGTGASEAIACMFCHQVTGLAGKPANTAHLVSPDGVRRAQIKDPLAPHPAAYSKFHQSSEICGGCHNVDHPVNGMHLEATYTEWKESPYAKEGVSCQDCHMSREPGSVGPFTGQAAGGAPQRDNIYKMSFVGAQVALGDSSAAETLLKSAAKVTMDAPQIVGSGEKAKVKVTVENVGAGHYLPTGLTEVREMWLELIAVGSDGKETKVGERKFGTVLKDAKGKYPVELWEAVAIQSDDRIPPRGTAEATYDYEMPAASAAVTLTARLMYRSAPEEFAKKAGVENPSTAMAVSTQRVYVSEEAKAAANKPKSGSPSSQGSILLLVVAAVASAATVILLVRRRSKRA